MLGSHAQAIYKRLNQPAGDKQQLGTGFFPCRWEASSSGLPSSGWMWLQTYSAASKAFLQFCSCCWSSQVNALFPSQLSAFVLRTQKWYWNKTKQHSNSSWSSFSILSLSHFHFPCVKLRAEALSTRTADQFAMALKAAATWLGPGRHSCTCHCIHQIPSIAAQKIFSAVMILLEFELCRTEEARRCVEENHSNFKVWSLHRESGNFWLLYTLHLTAKEEDKPTVHVMWQPCKGEAQPQDSENALQVHPREGSGGNTYS